MGERGGILMELVFREMVAQLGKRGVLMKLVLRGVVVQWVDMVMV